jgi:hypothetical protein
MFSVFISPARNASHIFRAACARCGHSQRSGDKCKKPHLTLNFLNFGYVRPAQAMARQVGLVTQQNIEF